MVPANNVLSFGSVKVRVCEYTLNERGEEIPFEANEHGDYPDTKAGGSDISRIVRVENVGAQPAYGIGGARRFERGCLGQRCV